MTQPSSRHERAQTIGGLTGFVLTFTGAIVGAANDSVVIDAATVAIGLATVTGLVLIEIRYGKKVTNETLAPATVPQNPHPGRDVPR